MKRGTSLFYKTHLVSPICEDVICGVPFNEMFQTNTTDAVLWNLIKICGFMSLTRAKHLSSKRTITHVTDTEYFLCLITHCNDNSEQFAESVTCIQISSDHSCLTQMLHDTRIMTSSLFLSVLLVFPLNYWRI